MKASPTTGMGLTIHNSTYYNTMDLVALLNAFEAAMKKSQRIFHICPIGSVDKQVSFRDYAGTRLQERVYSRGKVEDEEVYVRPGHGSNRGVYRFRKVGQMFTNPVEQLVWESTEDKTLPDAFVVQFLTHIAGAYSIDKKYIPNAVARVDLSQHRIRVLKNRAAPATKGNGNSKQRKAARSALTSLQFRLSHAVSTVNSVAYEFQEFDDMGEPNPGYRDVMAVRGQFPELAQLTDIIASLQKMMKSAEEAAASIVAPEFVKKEIAK